MIRSHKIRLNPTPEQEAYLRKAAGTKRFVFNWALAEWKRHKEIAPDVPFGPMALKKQFNAIKREQFPWVYEVTKCASDGAFFNLEAALKNYYDSKKGKRQGKEVGFPNFKSKKNSRQSFYLANDQIDIDGFDLHVPLLGWVNMAEPLRFAGKIMSAVVSCKSGRWYISIAVEIESPKVIIFPKASVGVDLGIKTLMVLSDGQQYENQALLRSSLTHLKRLNRRLSRRKQGSHRWQRAKLAVSRFHEKIANRRGDILHKATGEIAKTYAVIGLEDLNVAGMVKNRRLALSLSDASFGEIGRQLTYKSEQFGGQVVRVDRFFPSSRLCPNCGCINGDLTLADRVWTCDCGAVHDRDLNAARNIEHEALRIRTLGSGYVEVKARGRDVRPLRRQSRMKRELSVIQER